MLWRGQGSLARAVALVMAPITADAAHGCVWPDGARPPIVSSLAAPRASTGSASAHQSSCGSVPLVQDPSPPRTPACRVPDRPRPGAPTVSLEHPGGRPVASIRPTGMQSVAPVVPGGGISWRIHGGQQSSLRVGEVHAPQSWVTSPRADAGPGSRWVRAAPPRYGSRREGIPRRTLGPSGGGAQLAHSSSWSSSTVIVWCHT